VTRSARLRGLLLAAPLLAAPLLAAGCGTAQQTTATAAERPAGGSTAAAQPAGGPPAAAAMVCSEDITRKVRQVLGLPVAPATRATWASPVYTCDYALPAGPMTLSVHVYPDAARAGAGFEADRTRTPGAGPLAGLGQRAWGTATGTVEVLKDDDVLTVDTTRLPEVFGANGQKRTDLAYEVASDVLGCWTGDE
jgi:hypothetical protein